MGWFSSKKKTYVSTSVSRLFKDKDIPEIRKKNMIDRVMKNEPMTQAIINNALDSQALKLERAYRRAARGDYYYGVPNHNIYNAGSGRDAVENILVSQTGTTVRLDYFYFAPLNNLHYGWHVLTRDYQYNQFRNTLVYNGTTYWVTDMVGRINTQAITSDATAETVQELVPDDGTLAVWDRHPQDRYTPFRSGSAKTPVWEFSPDLDDGTVVYLVDKDGNETTLTISTVDFDRDLECFQAKYQYTEGGQRKIGYFTYEYGQGAYPELDALYSAEPVGQGTFFPVLIFRANDENRTAPEYHGTPAYESSVDLARSIGLDYQYLGDQVHENENAHKLDQAILMMGVPASTEDPDEAEYLFLFFNWLFNQSGDTTHLNALGSLRSYRPGQAIEIKEVDFNSTLSFDRLVRKERQGTVTAVGRYTCEEGSITRYRTIKRTSYNHMTDSHETTEVTEAYEIPVIWYRYQNTAGTYLELEVRNLTLRYNIYGNKGVDANVGSDKLLVPLDYYICRSMRYDRKERLYYRSLHFVFNARITETVKWYERGVFQVILAIAVVVITIYTGGTGAALTTALSSGAYAAAAIIIIEALVTSYLVGIAIQEGMKLVIKELGIDAGIVLAVAAFVAAVYGGMTDADWVKHAIQAGNNLTSITMEEYVKQEIAAYNSEKQAFELLAEEKMKELEEAENLLQQYPLLDPRSFVAQEPMLIVGESPDSLYTRTVHTGNPGILQYDYIESYVTLNTRLPTFDELVGETFL